MSPEQRADHITTDNISHSGNLPPERGQELPVREFDNTPLEQAHSEGLLKIPETPAAITSSGHEEVEDATFVDAPEEQVQYYGFEPVLDRPLPSKEKKGHGKLLVTLGAAAAAAAAAAALFLPPKGGEEGKSTTNVPAPSESVATTPASPTETAQAATKETYDLESMRIPAGLSNEAYANALVDRLNRWMVAGGTDENQDRWTSNPRDALLKSLASDNTFVGAPAIFGPDWQKNPTIAARVTDLEKLNNDYLRMRFMSNRQAMGPGQGFTEAMQEESVEVLSASGVSRTLSVSGIMHNNADKSFIGATFPKVKAANGQELKITFTTKIDPATNTEYIVNYTVS